MVRITPCISVVVQRKAVKNQELLEKWIKEANPSFTSYDDDLICMTIAMNPYDAKRSVENLNRRLGIQIYDESNPYEPVAKDGVVVERMFGFGAPCNWLKREKTDGMHCLSYIPENERRPIKVREYDPSKDIVVRDFGKYKGQPLLLMENRYELYIKLGTDRHGIPLQDHDNLSMKVAHEISREDAILCLECEKEDKDDFYDMMEKRIEKEREIDYVRRILVDLGESDRGHIYIARAECAERYGIRLVTKAGTEHYLLPEEYRESPEMSRSLTKEQVLIFIDEEIARKKEREARWREQRNKNSNSYVIKDLGDAPEGHLSINHGKFGNYIRLTKGEDWKGFRLPTEYRKDEELCKSLTLETVASFIDESKKGD